MLGEPRLFRNQKGYLAHLIMARPRFCHAQLVHGSLLLLAVAGCETETSPIDGNATGGSEAGAAGASEPNASGGYGAVSTAAGGASAGDKGSTGGSGAEGTLDGGAAGLEGLGGTGEAGDAGENGGVPSSDAGAGGSGEPPECVAPEGPSLSDCPEGYEPLEGYVVDYENACLPEPVVLTCRIGSAAGATCVVDTRDGTAYYVSETTCSHADYLVRDDDCDLSMIPDRWCD